MLVKTTREAITELLPIGCRKTKYKIRELADYLDFPVVTLRKIARSLGLTNDRTVRSRRWISEFAAQRLIILIRAEQQAWNEAHPNKDWHLERARERAKRPPPSLAYLTRGGSEKWAEEKVKKTAGAMRKREQYWQRKAAGLVEESKPRKRKPKTYDREIKW